MVELLLSLVLALSPEFSFSNKERGNYEADVFRIERDEEIKDALEYLISQEPKALERAISTVQIGERDKATITTLRDKDGQSKAAYFYRLDLPVDQNGWICRIRFDPEHGPGFQRTLQWCLSFIGGDSYRPTVTIPATSD